MLSLLTTAATKAVDLFVVAGVVWPYIPQAKSILQTKNSDGFSTMVSLIIIISGILRCFFWIGERFEDVLLVQAVMAVLAQLGMLYVVTLVNRTKNENQGATAIQRNRGGRTFLDFDFKYFWNWDDWGSYLQFAIALIVFLALLCGSFIKYQWFVQLLGTLALGIESTLPIPQALKNYRTKSTAGLSSVLIISWVAGDAFKTLYAVSKGAPFQFIACGAVQLTVDIVCMYQMLVLYPQTPANALHGRASPVAHNIADSESNRVSSSNAAHSVTMTPGGSKVSYRSTSGPK